MSDTHEQAAARALAECGFYDNEAIAAAKTMLAAVTPLIRAAALEEAARAFEPNEDGHDSHSLHWTAEEVAAALRALKEQP